MVTDPVVVSVIVDSVDRVDVSDTDVADSSTILIIEPTNNISMNL